ncbi:MAG TPA: hypothetical protein VLD57_04805, partial [Blastocatellia bacterium]|nr:hypothetical protein [Blastocatellia bacterium]
MHNRPEAILGLTLAVLLCASATRGAAIQQTPAGNKAAESASAESNAANKTAGVAKDQPAPAAPSVEDRLRALEQIIERQQREIEALRGLIEKREGVVATERASEAEQVKPAEAATGVAAEQSPPSNPAGTAQADKRLEDLHKKFGSLRVSGDVRVRAETFSNQGFDSPNEPPFRDRIRLRARLALDGVLNRNFDWGI